MLIKYKMAIKCTVDGKETMRKYPHSSNRVVMNALRSCQEDVIRKTCKKLIAQYGYPAERIVVGDNHPTRKGAYFADIVIYNEARKPFAIIECKTGGHSIAKNSLLVDFLKKQAATLGVEYFMLTNGVSKLVYAHSEEGVFLPVFDLPKFSTSSSSVAKELLDAKGMRFLFLEILNMLYNDGEMPVGDAILEIGKVLLCKIIDERSNADDELPVEQSRSIDDKVKQIRQTYADVAADHKLEDEQIKLSDGKLSLIIRMMLPVKFEDNAIAFDVLASSSSVFSAGYFYVPHSIVALIAALSKEVGAEAIVHCGECAGSSMIECSRLLNKVGAYVKIYSVVLGAVRAQLAKLNYIANNITCGDVILGGLHIGLIGKALHRKHIKVAFINSAVGKVELFANESNCTHYVNVFKANPSRKVEGGMASRTHFEAMSIDSASEWIEDGGVVVISVSPSFLNSRYCKMLCSGEFEGLTVISDELNIGCMSKGQLGKLMVIQCCGTQGDAEKVKKVVEDKLGVTL